MEGERYTFSSLVSNLIEATECLKNFYEEAGRRAVSSGLSHLFSTSVTKYARIREDMERVRRESVVEMTLEPITGIPLKNYLNTIKNVIARDDLKDLEKALKLEEVLCELSEKASRKIMHISADAGMLLKRMGRDSRERKALLEKIE